MKRTRRLSCKGKKKYATQLLAEKSMLSYARRELGGIKMNASTYKCPCGSWHWGHERKSKR